MNNQVDWDALEAYLDILNHQGEGKARLIENDFSESMNMRELFQVLQMLWRELRPAAPGEEFRKTLGERLVKEAQRRQTLEALAAPHVSRPRRPIWLVAPLAALGTASLVGAYAYWRFTRHNDRANNILAA